MSPAVQYIVFNRALALQNENHEAGNKFIPYTKMTSWLTEWKTDPETQWLKKAPSQPLQQSLKDLERGYKNFFQKRASFPRFKKREQNDAFRYPQGGGSSIRAIVEYPCQSWDGYAIAIAVKSLEK